MEANCRGLEEVRGTSVEIVAREVCADGSGAENASRRAFNVKDAAVDVRNEPARYMVSRWGRHPAEPSVRHRSGLLTFVDTVLTREDARLVAGY